jgi:hypothetical protein
MAPIDPMDVPLQSTSPSSRRNKGKLADAIQSMSSLSSMESLNLPTDPDAQATVTDFLDFTEYLPADMTRSLALITKMDQQYGQESATVHTLTSLYGELPDYEGDGKPDPVQLRADISQHVQDAVNARGQAAAEAQRMRVDVDRHYQRAKNILAKLEAMRDNYPADKEPSPIPEKSGSPVATRPKIKLHVDGGRSGEVLPVRVRKHRAPRITVPGEVLAPYELDYESYSDGWESDEPLTPADTLVPHISSNKIKIRINKVPKDKKTQKPPRAPRPPGVMGTNVHSQVAGISTSNALAKLRPPPEDAVKGDEHLPWLQLNAYELATLRKRMKKNAVWSPSDTMIARELKANGRGLDAYRRAKSAADAAGVHFPEDHEPPQLRGETVHAEGAMSVEAIQSYDPSLVNRGMKLNEAKKAKKEAQLREAEQEANQALAKISAMGKGLGGLFIDPNDKNKKNASKPPVKTPAKKRKRESPVEPDGTEKSVEGESTVKPARPPIKRNKTETPVPVPAPIAFKQASPLYPESVTSAPATPIEAPPGLLTAPLPSPKKSSTPILPPTKDIKKAAPKKEVKRIETAANSRPRRSSGAPTPTSAIIPESLPAKRPTSSRSNGAGDHNFTATATSDRPRRASTARNTPAPELKQNKRAKRPAPGVVTAPSDGSTAVSVGKRSSATRKKAGPKKDPKAGPVQELDEFDDDGNVIDPDEPRYCLCDRVSFGIMIGCENKDVSFLELFMLIIN